MFGISRIISTLGLTCALTLGVTGSAAAQYRIDTWSTDNGLPQNVVTDIAQTRDGFLWLSTFGGLVRFDGANMHVFTTINAPGMRSSRLSGGLVETPDGALWVNTEGHGVVRHLGGVFSTFGEAEGVPKTGIRTLQTHEHQPGYGWLAICDLITCACDTRYR